MLFHFEISVITYIYHRKLFGFYFEGLPVMESQTRRRLIVFCSSKFIWILTEAEMKLVFVLVVCFHISGKAVCHEPTLRNCFWVKERHISGFTALKAIICL